MFLISDADGHELAHFVDPVLSFLKHFDVVVVPCLCPNLRVQQSVTGGVFMKLIEYTIIYQVQTLLLVSMCVRQMNDVSVIMLFGY